MDIKITPVSEHSRNAVAAQITASWASPLIVSRGTLYDSRLLPGFAAFDGDLLAGYALYNITGDECELVVLESLRSNAGIGGTLIREVIKIARENNSRRVWLVTTNDNTQAIRFYQRFGFELAAVHFNAMDEARKLKPQIPLTGDDDIFLKHEFEFEILLKNEGDVS